VAMATLFTKILNGEIPGAFVYRDELCGAFMDIAPMNPGHVLLVPVKEVDLLWALDGATYAHLWEVARTKIEPALKQATGCPRVGVAVEGFAVPHAHIHMVPLWGLNELDPHRAKKASPEELKVMQEKILRAMKG
jgi:histidine triad (HIT) family protein